MYLHQRMRTPFHYNLKSKVIILLHVHTVYLNIWKSGSYLKGNHDCIAWAYLYTCTSHIELPMTLTFDSSRKVNIQTSALWIYCVCELVMLTLLCWILPHLFLYCMIVCWCFNCIPCVNPVYICHTGMVGLWEVCSHRSCSTTR